MDNDVVNIRDQLAVLRRRWLIVVAAVVLAVGAALAFSLAQTPLYRAEAKVIVEPFGSVLTSGGSVIEPEELATQVEVITALPLAEDVAERPDIAGEPEDLLDSLNVQVAEGTRTITVAALAAADDEAAAVANAFAYGYVEARRAQEAERIADVREVYADQLTALQDRARELTPALVQQATPSEQPVLRAERRSLAVQQAEVSAQLAGLAGATAQGGGRVFSDAQPPTNPAQPRPLRNAALAAVLGLLFGIGLAFLRDFFDDAVRDERRLRGALGSRPILGRVPRSAEDRKGRVATLVAPQSRVSEAYRALNTNVRFLLAAARPTAGDETPQTRPSQNGRLLLVTSAGPGEGKTSVASNLAVAAAGVGLRVVLVDGDLRRPNLSERFGVTGLPGLSDVLATGAPVGSHLLDVGIDGLAILAGGAMPPNPAELLASPALRSVLSDLTTEADLIVVDSAPLLRVADTLELVPLVDVVLLVVRRGVSRLRMVSSAVERVRHVGGNVAGAVYNDVEGRGDGASYGYGSGNRAAPPRAAAPQRQAFDSDAADTESVRVLRRAAH